MGRTRMRTAGITAIAGPVVLLELPESPDPRPNEVAIGVRAAGVRQLGRPPSRRGGRTCRPHSDRRLRGSRHVWTNRRIRPRAFADSSSWNGVITRLQAKGVPVVAPPTRCVDSPPTRPTAPSSPCPPSRSKVTPTAPRIRALTRTQRSSRGPIRTGRSRAASDTTFRRKRPRLSRKRYSNSRADSLDE